jgi:hypothetical protein
LFRVRFNLIHFRDFTKRKQAILKALEIKLNTLLDSHLSKTKLKIPPAFRSGLKFKLADEVKPESKALTPAPPENSDEGITVKEKEEELPKEELPEAPAEMPDVSQSPLITNSLYFQVEVSLKEIDEAYKQLMTFADPNNEDVLILTAKHAVAHEHFGTALRCINKALEEKSTNKLLWVSMHEVRLLDRIEKLVGFFSWPSNWDTITLLLTSETSTSCDSASEIVRFNL